MQPANRNAARLDGFAIKPATARPDELPVAVDDLAVAGELRKPPVSPARNRIVEVRGHPGDETVLLVVVQFPVEAGGIRKIAGVHDHAAQVVRPDSHDVVFGERLELRGDVWRSEEHT